MKLHRSFSLASLLLATVVLPAAADVKLDLAVHEAARAARKQGFQKLLLVVREDVRSARDQEIGGVLRTLERLTADGLTLEPRVTPVASRNARVRAHSAKARTAMTPAEVGVFTGTASFDAVLSLDYQHRRITNVRMTLLNKDGVYFSETVRLSGRPQPDDDLFAAAMSAVEEKSDGGTAQLPKELEDEKSEKKPMPPGSKKAGSGNPLADAAAAAKRDFPSSGMIITKNRVGQRMLVRSSPRAAELQAIIDALNLALASNASTRTDGGREGNAENGGDGGNGEGGAGGRGGAGGDNGHPADCPCRKVRNPEGSGDAGNAEGGPRRECPNKPKDEDGSDKPGDGESDGDGNGDGESGGDDDGQSDEERDPAPVPFGDLPPLNEEVLKFASNNLGHKVGRGECWDLADQALRASGAEPARGYVFGERIDVDDVIPGDILQFTSARFDEPGYWVLMGTPNHTAVVQAVDEQRLFILQQNFSGKRYVTTYDFTPGNMTSGTLEAFRPIPRESRR